MKFSRRAPLGVIAVLCWVATPVEAQLVRGSVVERDGRTAVPGVVVLLRDSTGNSVARALTDDRGEFSFQAAAAGTHRLRALRIGYEPTDSDPFVIDAGDARDTQLMLSGAPIRLRAVRVTERSTCDRAGDESLDAFRVWEEARKALLAASITGADRRYEVRMVRYNRWLDQRDRLERQVLSETHGVSVNSFVSVPAHLLREEGYVVSDHTGVTYRGADASVLASDDFARSYCLRITGDSSSTADSAPDLIAVSFAPARARRTGSDLTGTLWLHRETAELRALDFRYTGLERPRADHARGRAEFARLTGGGWMINRFFIRMPLMAASRTSSERQFLSGIQVAGGELLMVRRAGRLIYESGVTLRGVVRNAGGRPVAGARINIEGVDRIVTSDSSGRFTFPMLPAGPHVVRLQTALLDSLDVPPIETQLELSAGTPPLELIAPAARDALTMLCRDTPADRWNHRSLVYGHARDRDGVFLVRAQIRITWYESGATKSGNAYNRSRTEETRVAEDGSYRLCNIPRDEQLTLYVRPQGGTWTSAGGLNIAPVTMYVRREIVIRR